MIILKNFDAISHFCCFIENRLTCIFEDANFCHSFISFVTTELSQKLVSPYTKSVVGRTFIAFPQNLSVK
jgi:hypothetical protein